MRKPTPNHDRIKQVAMELRELKEATDAVKHKKHSRQ
jgi:hypothetical protein